MGRIKIEWRGGSLRQEAQGWSLEGVTFQGEFAVESSTGAGLVSTGPFELTVGTVTTKRFGAKNVLVRALLDGRRELIVNAAQVEIAGGKVTVDPCDVSLTPLEVKVNLRISRVGLQDIVLLVPAAGLADARGRIDGEVQVKWSEAVGFQLGVGHLGLCDDEPAIIRLMPKPGLLTARVPKYIDFTPRLGMFGKLLRAKNPAYGNIRSVELGETDLQVKTLDVQLTPVGDDKGRSATARIVAQPTEPGSKVSAVTFDVNVDGPVSDVVKLGLEQGFTLDVY